MPKKPRFLMIAFSLMSVLVLLLSACGASQQGSNQQGSTGTPVKGGTWIDDLYEEPDSLIPNASSETFAYMVQYGLYAPLVYGTPGGQLMPGVATAVPTVANGLLSADLKTVTFHLRSGVVWSDGQPLDARDVDFTWHTQNAIRKIQCAWSASASSYWPQWRRRGTTSSIQRWFSSCRCSSIFLAGMAASMRRSGCSDGGYMPVSILRIAITSHVS